MGWQGLLCAKKQWKHNDHRRILPISVLFNTATHRFLNRSYACSSVAACGRSPFRVLSAGGRPAASLLASSMACASEAIRR